MARYGCDIPSLEASDLFEPAIFPNHNVDVDGKAACDLAHLNAPDEPLEHTFLEKMCTELQKGCLCVNFAAPSSMTDGANFAPRCAATLVAGYILSSVAFQRSAKQAELQVKCDRLVARLSSVTSKCITWRSLLRDRGYDMSNLQASLNTSKDWSSLLEGQTVVLHKKKRPPLLS